MTFNSKLLPQKLLFDILVVCCCVVVALTQASLAQSQQAFSLKVVTPAGDQFWTNSIVIEGNHELMLVDAQLTKTNSLIKAMKQQFPSSDLLLTLERGAKANVAH